MIPRVRLSLVVAMSENGVIGREGALPWHLRSDLALFKRITHSKPIIMGSNTWDSLPRKPLPGRLNLVLSRDLKFEAEGGVICSSMYEAMEIAREQAIEDGAPGGETPEICVIGGANVFEQVMAKADRLYVTTVHATIEGDTVFPAIDPEAWRVTSEEAFPKGEGDDYDFTFRVYDRAGTAS
ncbi:MAG: dihydrofolate reductase [Asticcacaulis sp.]